MLISTKGRYALRFMAELAQLGDKEYVPLKDVSQNQNISLKYLEGIAADLKNAGYISGRHGKGGGYKLALPSDKCTVKQILTVTEGSLSPVACLKYSDGCERAADCKTLPMWKKLYETIDDFFDGITLSELTSNSNNKK